MVDKCMVTLASFPSHSHTLSIDLSIVHQLKPLSSGLNISFQGRWRLLWWCDNEYLEAQITYSYRCFVGQ